MMGIFRKPQRWVRDNRRWVTLALILLAVLAVVARAGPGLPETQQLKGLVQPASGYSYVINLDAPAFPWRMFGRRGDTNNRADASTLRLLEDGKALPAPHALHADIVEKGQGRFSHWGAEGDTILFSASDNSNPVTNGRVYKAEYRLYLRGLPFACILLFVVISLIVLYWPQSKRSAGQAEAKSAPEFASSGEPRKIHPLKASVFTVLALGMMSCMAIGLVVAADMVWRLVRAPMDTGIGIDTAFYDYRDYVVTTQPAGLVLGKSKHPFEGYYGPANCAAPDGTTARFNSLGFRSPEFIGLPPKQPNEVRIIVTGGSVSISHNVAETCTLDANLQRLLTQRFPGKTFKVFNLGSGAWKSFQELIAIQRYGIDIKPDLILALDGFNDITHSFNSDVRAGYAGWRMQEAYIRLRDWVWGGPLTSFQGIRIIHDFPLLMEKLSFNMVGRASAANSPDEIPAPPLDLKKIAQTDFGPRNQAAVDLYLRNMKIMDLVAQSSGSKILHVLQPMLYLKEPLSPVERRLLKNYEQEMIDYSIHGYLRMSPAMEELTRGSTYSRYIDLSAPFQGDPETYFHDYAHMNPGGYRIVSARIADVIAEMLQAQLK